VTDPNCPACGASMKRLADNLVCESWLCAQLLADGCNCDTLVVRPKRRERPAMPGIHALQPLADAIDSALRIQDVLGQRHPEQKP
jgi:hypothetical protein